MTKLIFHKADRVQQPEQIVRELQAAGYSPETVAKTVAWIFAGEVYLDETNTYQVDKREAQHNFAEDIRMWHLSIKRVDREPIHDWRVLQDIKNAMLGEQCEAVELYPAESRLVDTANQYHLFGFDQPWPDLGFPFGFTERMVVDDPNFPRAKQRPRPQE